MKPSRQHSIAVDARWPRIVARDKLADGIFWYSVATTGVYCRPSCPSRGANIENVRIHDTLDDARASGARPCLRCNPEGRSLDAQNAAMVERACRMIETAEQIPALAELAAAAQRSPSYFHRIFRAATGLTPKGYALANRASRARTSLRAEASVTEAIYAAGFASNGRFYESATAMFGMTPGKFRAGGTNETLHFAVGQCALGAILVASSTKGVAAVLIGDDPDELARNLQDQFPNANLVGGDADYEDVVARIVGLVEAPGTGFDLPLDVRGTAFQHRVWQALRGIPAGLTVTYAELAVRIGAPQAIRAVAGACAANRHAVAIPCHRVIRTDGSLSGYRWGVARKRWLLDTEGAVLKR